MPNNRLHQSIIQHRVEGIYHNKRCAQSKIRQEPTCLFFQWYCFACKIICKQNVHHYKEVRMKTGYGTEGYEKIHTGEILLHEHIRSKVNLRAK